MQNFHLEHEFPGNAPFSPGGRGIYIPVEEDKKMEPITAKEHRRKQELPNTQNNDVKDVKATELKEGHRKHEKMKLKHRERRDNKSKPVSKTRDTGDDKRREKPGDGKRSRSKDNKKYDIEADLQKENRKEKRGDKSRENHQTKNDSKPNKMPKTEQDKYEYEATLRQMPHDKHHRQKRLKTDKNKHKTKREEHIITPDQVIVQERKKQQKIKYGHRQRNLEETSKNQVPAEQPDIQDKHRETRHRKKKQSQKKETDNSTDSEADMKEREVAVRKRLEKKTNRFKEKRSSTSPVTATHGSNFIWDIEKQGSGIGKFNRNSLYELKDGKIEVYEDKRKKARLEELKEMDTPYKVILIPGDNPGVRWVTTIGLLATTLFFFAAWGSALFYILTPDGTLTNTTLPWPSE